MMAKKLGAGLSRRQFVAAGGATAAVATIGAPAILKAADKPIVIGHQLDQTGVLASYAPWYDRAAKGAIDRINKAGGIGGRQVNYAVENTASKVEIGLPAIEKLVKREGADFILGSLHSGIALGSTKVCKNLNTLYFVAAHAEEVTGSGGNRYVFRVSSQSETEGEATATKDLITEFGTKWSIFYADYAWGQSHARVWRDRLKRNGAEILSEVGMPLGASDLVPYLSKIHRGTQACVVALFASDAVGFIQQREALGFNFKLMGMQGLTAAISPDVLKGAAGFYVPESLPRRLKDKNTSHNKLLRDTVGADENGKEIGGNQWLAESYYWVTWTHVNLIKKGILASGWKSKDDNLKMIEAMEGMKLEESDDFPQGSTTIRPQDHQAFVDLYLTQIQDDGFAKVLRKLEPKQYPPSVDFRKESI
ncbi:MAG: ABC transporter substrate-binding protein [Alphaproteobacteria bacterium]|nr:MAG: ABC transporter substrate-binding protein [Alphaproteobacteria bacterium]